MTDLPKSVEIHEEGPREGFQIEPGPIASGDKVRLIEALAQTGLRDIQVCSFVNQRLVPGWADAEDVVRSVKPAPGVDYTALWFNDKGLERALACGDKLKLAGAISLSASEAFTRMNLHRSHAENLAAMRKQTALHLAKGLAVTRIGVMAAFGCNFQGDISPEQVVRVLADGFAIADEAGVEITTLSLADTMGWATPLRIERTVDAVRERWPAPHISLHLHDTRGLAVANAFAAHKGAAGNICTEELVLLCEEMGIATGVDLDGLIEVGRMAETIVGHPLPSELLHAGSLPEFRRRIA